MKWSSIETAVNVFFSYKTARSGLSITLKDNSIIMRYMQSVERAFSELINRESTAKNKTKGHPLKAS